MLLFTHPAMLGHINPPEHPESVSRLMAVLKGLEGLDLERRVAPRAEMEAIARVHPWAYIRAVDEAFPKPGEGMVAIDGGDTFLSDGSGEACYRAAGACVAAVDAVLAGEDDAAFCAVRPPGHHAEPAQPMGFCIFNNVAIAALHALEAHGLSRVAVVDFDVHHGNGTEAVAKKDPRLFFASTHQTPLYPGTGLASEHGPAGNVLNVPLPPGADGADWRAAMTASVLPALVAFKPELILVSAGFDAHKDDPLAALNLDEADFAWAAKRLREIALQQCKGMVVSTLEGGYDLAALARSAQAYVRAFQRA